MEGIRLMGSTVSMFAESALENAQQQAREAASRVQNEVTTGCEKVRQQASEVANLDISKVCAHHPSTTFPSHPTSARFQLQPPPPYHSWSSERISISCESLPRSQPQSWGAVPLHWATG
jgi:hypothetical protein